ncbi:hypothetical protein [Streptomyces sp. VRA16 Mangrove soil]|uniref:hypothetical protein n=1 Tax=Streptomyces sp. VRA16 Mangrove soil TaxID=2817434 RepID=UPI001A9DE1BD|nr:hypothetical protein [Streptomyces sp. VRA16 Mangrove soil]MBO1333731.1 hypothetical protein [Streptomyces sp. VRA16 Mangrove soil]
MRGDPSSSDARPALAPATEPLTAAEIDEILAGLGRCSAALVQQSQADQQRAEELNTRSESGIQRRIEGQEPPYSAESVALSVRLRLANRCAKDSRDAAREFVCWWVDAAVTAWTAVVHELPVTRARLGAAAPDTLLADDDVAVLPAVNDKTRELVELGAFLGDPRMAPDNDDDTASMATDLAARSGLSLRRNVHGDIEVIENVDPEARRRRLWGECWLQLGIPALPGPDDLDVLLAHAPGEASERLLSSSRAVVRASMAISRLSELEDIHEPWTPEQIDEYDRLSALLDEVTPLLADYARDVTESLPALRAARNGRGESTDRAD